MIQNIQGRQVILLSAEFYYVFKGLKIKAKERNSLTASVGSTQSVWIEISSPKGANIALGLSYQLPDHDGIIDCDMLREIREIPRAESATVLGDCNYPHVDWSNVTLECESEIKFLGVIME